MAATGERCRADERPYSARLLSLLSDLIEFLFALLISESLSLESLRALLEAQLHGLLQTVVIRIGGRVQRSLRTARSSTERTVV